MIQEITKTIKLCIFNKNNWQINFLSLLIPKNI